MNKDLSKYKNEQMSDSTQSFMDSLFTENHFTEGQEQRIRCLMSLTAQDVNDWWHKRVCTSNVVNLK